MAYPTELKYTKDHEWVRLSGDTAEVGITEYAQQQLGDVVYVELPEVGRALKAGEQFGSIESVKAASELFSPLDGEVTAVNPDLQARPESVNSHPHEAWMIKVRVARGFDAGTLLDSGAYERLVGA